MKRLDDCSWQHLLELLRERQLPSNQIAEAIVKIGKPFDERRIQTAKAIVANYLNDPNSWVRREALWFLGSWGRLREYESSVTSALMSDPDEDNRAFAANCLGVLDAGRNDAAVMEALSKVVLNEQETDAVRLSAYGAMLTVAGVAVPRTEIVVFELGEKHLKDIDWEWVTARAGPQGAT